MEHPCSVIPPPPRLYLGVGGSGITQLHPGGYLSISNSSLQDVTGYSRVATQPLVCNYHTLDQSCKLIVVQITQDKPSSLPFPSISSILVCPPHPYPCLNSNPNVMYIHVLTELYHNRYPNLLFLLLSIHPSRYPFPSLLHSK